jgi:small ligand-binding sensory domain FIST
VTEPKAASLRVDGPCRPEAVLRAAKQIRKKLGSPAKAAFVFAAADFLPQAEELCEILRVDGHIRDVAGCAVTGQVCDGKEFGGAQGFSVLALAGGVSEPVVCERGLGAVAGADGAVLLQSGIAEDFDARLAEWDRKFPGSALAGGVTGRARDGGPCVFLNGKRVESVAVSAADGACVLPFVAQGCRPIGEPLTVTRADHNILYSLGGQPAYRVLERAFETLSDDEKSRAKGNLFAGLAGNEYLEEFRSGDFLIKNIIGADPDSGAVVIVRARRPAAGVQAGGEGEEAGGGGLVVFLRGARGEFLRGGKPRCLGVEGGARAQARGGFPLGGGDCPGGGDHGFARLHGGGGGFCAEGRMTRR